ncbi:ribosomal RNA-processing protein 8 [Drosophila sulfurigaster albostrigata]|uniref:ribosomal RNA-processing protein 8 n=1 Tax=Drosophila sulfurigaster albostrigata TaxID=89887 RepID=UPI002D219847|nr:ribosomal RNA-processing protein 8 [Drosophila sulfurigaster albostrigata]
MAFEVPAWDKGALAVKFKPGATPAIDIPKTKPKKLKQKKPKVKKSERKQKSKVKQQINSTYRLGKGPLAPPVESSDSEADDEMRAMHKIRSGRIEKQKPPVKAAKDQKKQLTLKPALLQAAVEAMETTPTIASAPSATAAPEGALANKLHAELMGGRFRYINEQLYTMNSKKAEDLFRSDSGAFDAYHAGYRQQVEKWPSNPLNRIIKLVKRLSKTAVIGDFGCGEGKLAQSVPNKVYSMDLVSRRADIVACNITKTPLEAQALDVAVYCLSLMGTNLNDYLLEANRVLKLHGNVYIAEIQSRFEDVREFIRFMTSCGFDLVKKDVAVNYFYFFHFRKMRHVGKDVKLKPFSLKPCLYRKR